ncbi:MAG: hypothetical protein WA919_06670 [Coleofasciculaceae cyanobacterium]
MKVKYVATFAIASIMSLGLVAGCNNTGEQPDTQGGTEEVNPCASKENPCAAKENPCASKGN